MTLLIMLALASEPTKQTCESQGKIFVAMSYDKYNAKRKAHCRKKATREVKPCDAECKTWKAKQ